MQYSHIGITDRKNDNVDLVSMITINVSFLSEHSRNSLYLVQNSPLGTVNEMFHSCSVSNSVKFSSVIGDPLLVAVTFKILHSPAESKQDSSGLWRRTGSILVTD